MPHFHLIIADNIDNTQRNLIHELVKEASDSWWHELPDVWVVKGGPKDASGWRDQLKALVAIGSSRVLVLQLKAEAGGRWAASGKTAGFVDWFKANMSAAPAAPRPVAGKTTQSPTRKESSS